jgi:hypothetical protein
MEVTGLSGVGGEAQLLITGAAGEQPLIMSAEDAAQLLAQAGLQLADIGASERIIIEGARHDDGDGEVSRQRRTGRPVTSSKSQTVAFQVGMLDANGVVSAESLLSAASLDVGGDGGDLNDGAVLYIDPTDPQVRLLA